MRHPRLCLSAAAIMSLAACAPGWAQASKTVWDGVYTAAQAERGRALFAKNCALCHGQKLEGANDKPGLAGPYFLVHWSDKSVRALFDFIAVQMSPASGTLAPDATADLIAYILSANGLPAGGVELPANPSALDAIAIKPVRLAR